MKSRRFKIKILAFFSGVCGFLAAKLAEDNLPSFAIKKEAALRAWNGIFPTLTHLFFASWFVLGFLGIQYVVMHSRNFFLQAGYVLVLLLALLFIYSLSKSKDPKDKVQALGLSIIIIFFIGFMASLKAQRTLNAQAAG